MTDVKKVVVVSSLAIAALVPACGGGSGSCGKVEPCGGDVVGSYSITAACVNAAALNMQPPIADCPGATISVGSIGVSGSASFNADLTYSVSETITVSASETIPASCLTMSGITLTCAQLDQALQQLIAQQPGMFQSARCSGSSSCTCSFTLAPQNISESGTYTTSGTTITMTDAAGGISSAGYCVQGSELHLVTLDMTMPMGTIQADTVLTKR